MKTLNTGVAKLVRSAFKGCLTLLLAANPFTLPMLRCLMTAFSTLPMSRKIG